MNKAQSFLLRSFYSSRRDGQGRGQGDKRGVIHPCSEMCSWMLNAALGIQEVVLIRGVEMSKDGQVQEQWRDGGMGQGSCMWAKTQGEESSSEKND